SGGLVHAAARCAAAALSSPREPERYAIRDRSRREAVAAAFEAASKFALIGGRPREGLGHGRWRGAYPRPPQQDRPAGQWTLPPTIGAAFVGARMTCST